MSYRVVVLVAVLVMLVSSVVCGGEATELIDLIVEFEELESDLVLLMDGMEDAPRFVVGSHILKTSLVAYWKLWGIHTELIMLSLVGDCENEQRSRSHMYAANHSHLYDCKSGIEGIGKLITTLYDSGLIMMGEKLITLLRKTMKYQEKLFEKLSDYENSYDWLTLEMK